MMFDINSGQSVWIDWHPKFEFSYVRLYGLSVLFLPGVMISWSRKEKQ